MLYLIVERFKGRDPAPIYARLRERGRMMPEGLTYVGSWIETNYDRCFQVMETEDERQLHEWIASWSDLMDFEIVPVETSATMRARFGGDAPR